MNSIKVIAAIIKELWLFYLNSIFYIIRKLLVEALFHNQAIFLVLANYFIMKIQQAFHNFLRFHHRIILYIEPYYMVWDVKRMDHTYHCLLLDIF